MQCMLVNAFICIAVARQKWIVFLKLNPADEVKDALLKLKIKKKEFRIRIRIFSFVEEIFFPNYVWRYYEC